MISASHNPAPDNGIKFFATGGRKLPDEVEDRIEAAMHDQSAPTPTRGDVGRITRFADAEDRYVVHLLGTLPHRLDGLHVVLDCAKRAAAGVSPEVFVNAGAKVTLIGADPDGNEHQRRRRSTHIDNLARAVLEAGADVGIAHDGDADRCLAVDADGKRGRRRPDHGDPRALPQGARSPGVDTLVATVMSNLGLIARWRTTASRSSRPPSATATCSRR